MSNESGFEAYGDQGFQTDEQKWFSSPARGLTRRPSSPSFAPPPSTNLDDSVFDRWASVPPRSE